MKKIIGYLPTYVLYYLGHWTSLLMAKFKWYFLYDIYSWLMIKSADVQDWAGLKKPWYPPAEK